MKAAYFFAVLAVAVAAVNAKAAHGGKIASEPAQRPAPWYDCTGKQPGNYENPRDCTRFIACDAGLRAIEFDCPDCSNVPSRCTPQNRLVYNSTVDQCLWADETRCGGDGGEGSSEESSESGEGGSGEGTTESNGGGRPKPGDPCNPEDCRNDGDCQSYLRCDKDDAVWVEEKCGDGMFWNPDSGTVHGGNCDLLENLSEEVERRYRSDPNCLGCFWKAGECSRDYQYQAPGNRNRNVLDLQCADGLVFSEAKETCQRCSEAKRADGSACC